MSRQGISSADRKVVKPALEKEEKTGSPAVAIELNDGTIITGKTSSFIGASAAALLNALKYLANIDDSVDIVPPTVIEPLQKLKVNHMGAVNPRLHTDEILMALAIGAVDNPTAKLALGELDKLKNCEIHSTVILSHVDENTFKTLGMRVTCEPKRG